MEYHRVRLSLEDDPVNGPFPSIDAIAAIGYDKLVLRNKSGAIFWADHSKTSYYGFQEVTALHVDNTTWYYEVANPLDECSVQYGRVRVYVYSSTCIIIDSFSRELYAAKDLRKAFEVAVMLVHYYPDERVVPDIELGYTAVLPKQMPTQADTTDWSPQSLVRVYDDNNRVPVAIDRDVRMGVGDAISIIMGDKPSEAFISRLCSTFPQALVAAYGAPLILYDKATTAISVGQSISSVAMSQDIFPHEAVNSFLSNKTVGKYTVVGGWAYDLLRDLGTDTMRLGVVDLALAHSGSPEITRAIVRPMLDQITGDPSA